jgi:hypothetical protein
MIVTLGDYGPRTDARRVQASSPRQAAARSIQRMTVAESIRPHSVRFTSNSVRIGASQRTDALCQERARAMQQTEALLNHLVSAREKRFRDRESKRVSCFEIYDQLKFGR